MGAINGDAWYRALFDGAADGVLVADDDGVYVDANPAAARLFGVAREHLIGQRVADFVVQQGDDLRQHWSRFIDSDQERGRVQIRRSDGTVIVCAYSTSANFVPGRHLSTLRDVTALVEAEQQREASEHRFRRMLDALDLLALVTDTDGRATFVNRSMLTRLGLQLNDVVGLRLTSAQSDGDAQHAAFMEAVATEQITPEWENDIVTADGSLCRVRWSSAFVRDQHGRIEAVASIGEDVTIRRHLEEQVRHAVRVESLGRFAGGVAHDFNNFLMVIGGHAELLAAAPELSASSREHLATVTAGIDRAAQLTRQLLAYGRQQVMEAREVSVGSAIDALRIMLAPMLGAAIAIEAVNLAENDVVFIDPAQLDQVLINLALNARDAMPNGGTLRFEVRSTEINDAAAAPLGLDSGQYVQLAVKDTGEGIPTDMLAQVFEPFVTTKPVGHGTGLGLSSAYGIVTQSGGAITVDSAPGHGATFTIHLPVRAPSEPAPHVTSRLL